MSKYAKYRVIPQLSRLVTAFKIQICLSGREERDEMEKREKILEAEQVWQGVKMCDCSTPLCSCLPIESERTALKYALYSYWEKRVKPMSRVMVSEFEQQYGKWKERRSWRNFVIDVFKDNNLKAVEIIDAYKLSG